METSEKVADLPCDIADEFKVRRLALLVTSRFRRREVVVHNAGIEGRVLPISDYPADAFRRVLDLHITGTSVAIKHLAPLMRDAAGCSVVNCASATGLRGSPKMSASIASKHVVVGLTRAMAVELALRGIRVSELLHEIDRAHR